ncbi:MAG TPA: YetF domain-containing protein [Candidatus Limnocylindria bacterium]|nr:YetF domain-containing protein [Candidatus Limnocylindria bacterium]
MPLEWLVADPDRLVKTALLGTLSYAALIAMLRVTGKRTLAQMNAFDFVVTVALGSTLSAILVSPEVSLAQGILALGLLVGLQFVVTFGTVRLGWLGRLIKNEPRMLVYRGRMLDDAMRGERVAPAEVHQALRASGILSIEQVHAVVLETDGTFSVIGDEPAGEPTALGDMRRPPPR